MTSERRLETWIHAPRERHDALARDLIGPLALDIAPDPSLGALYFGRYNKPDWHLRLCLRGRADWLDREARGALDGRLAREQARGSLVSFEYADHTPDLVRYGGEEGLRIAERIFHHDTMACVGLLASESRGLCVKSRREHCLIMTERYLDLLRFTRDERLTFYRYSYSFELDLGRWQQEECDALERRYRSIKNGLLELFGPEAASEPERLWGGPEPARIAQTFIESAAPLLRELAEGQAAGRVARSRVDLAWALTHMHCNRLQVEADAEALIRFLMHRLHEEEAIA